MISLRVSRARGKLGSEQLGYMYRKRLAGGGHRDTVEGERWALFQTSWFVLFIIALPSLLAQIWFYRVFQ